LQSNPKSNSLQLFACAVGMYMVADVVIAMLSVIMAIFANNVIDSLNQNQIH